MRNIKDLSNAEADAYLNDMTEAHSNAAKSVIKIADKYRLDRDEAMKHFSTVMVAAAECVTFKNYKFNEEEADENRG